MNAAAPRRNLVAPDDAWTPERDQVVLDRWADLEGCTARDIMAAVNALPGQIILVERAIGKRAVQLGMPRGRIDAADAAFAARQAAARKVSFLTTPDPAAPEPPAPTPPRKESLRTDAAPRPAPPIARPPAQRQPDPNADKAEAMKLLLAGMSGRSVADELDLPLRLVAEWAAEARAQLQAQRAGATPQPERPAS